MVGGLLFSQVLTLYITPVFFLYMETFQEWLGRRFPSLSRREAGAREPVTEVLNPVPGLARGGKGEVPV